MTYEVVEATRVEYYARACLVVCVAFVTGVLVGVWTEGGLRPADRLYPVDPAKTFALNRVAMPDDKVVVLHFLSDREWRNVEPIPNAAAFTDWSTWPCTVYAPASNFSIVVYPAVGYARWEDFNADEYLSHEVLHCLAGGWHPDWKTIAALNVKGVRRDDARDAVQNARRELPPIGSLK